MVSSTDLLIRDYILGAWRGLDASARPQNLWVCLHAPVAVDHDAMSASSPLIAAWFVDGWGVRAESAWTYLRFYTMHQIQPWCARMVKEHTDVFGGAGAHRIGIAAFARYEGTAAYWVAVMWGGLQGEGLIVSVDAQGAIRVEKQLWIS